MSRDLDSGRIRYTGFGGLGMQLTPVVHGCKNVHIPIGQALSD